MRTIKEVLKNKVVYFILGFIVISLLISIKLISNPQTIAYDAQGYFDLGKHIFDNKFHILSINFNIRTFIFPLYVAFSILISKIIHVNDFQFIYFLNYLVFLFSILLVFKTINDKNKIISYLFLIFSAFNLVNLSFINTILTESLTVFFVCMLFYLLNLNLNSRMILFLVGLFSSLNVITRPSNLFLFICLTIFIVTSFRKNLPRIFYFFLPVILIFGLSTLNVYKTEGHLGLFTNATQSLYAPRVRDGVKYMKYETIVDSRFVNHGVFYQNLMPQNIYDPTCKTTLGCMWSYFFRYPIQYLTLTGLHAYNLFDRMYLDTYIPNFSTVDVPLMIYNYLVLSSVICYLIFFLKTESLKYVRMFLVILLLFAGTIVIYLPSIVEPRYSSAVFPLLTLLASFHFFRLFQKRKAAKIRNILLFQTCLILFFFVVSYLVRNNAILN